MAIDYAKLSETAEKIREWNKTDLGKLFNKYESCIIALYQRENDPGVPLDRLKELYEAFSTARAEFLLAIRGF